MEQTTALKKLSNYNFQEPLYENASKGFTSELVDQNNKYFYFNTGSFKFLNLRKDPDNDSVQILSCEFMPENDEMYQFILTLDEKVKSDIIRLGKEFMNLSLEDRAVNHLYKSSLNCPRFIPSMPYIELCYDTNKKGKKKGKKPLDINKLTPGQIIDAKVQVGAIIFLKNKCYITLNIEEIKIVDEI